MTQRVIGVLLLFVGSLDMGVHPTATNIRATIEVLSIIVGAILIMEVFSSET